MDDGREGFYSTVGTDPHAFLSGLLKPRIVTLDHGTKSIKLVEGNAGSVNR